VVKWVINALGSNANRSGEFISRMDPKVIYVLRRNDSLARKLCNKDKRWTAHESHILVHK